ncbi:amino acid adenylation domain-containing protein [Methanimicrococcus sp. OttesenSCG-928-J09]|nr:amino acid adenylation domain-containing protein [Methanimicrococcus sp. OttesenSCG-928-J09]
MSTKKPTNDLQEEWPLTFAERQMTAEQGMNPTSVAYNLNRAYALSGPLDAARLQIALNEVLNRHIVLKSYYPIRDGEYSRRINKEMVVEIQTENCPADKIKERVVQENIPFDLENGPLFKCLLFQTAPDEHILHFNVHHSILDGTAINVMMTELIQLYDGNELQPVEFDFQDYALFQNKNPENPEDEEYFKKIFSDGLPENEMPTLPLRPEVLPFVEIEIKEEIPGEMIQKPSQRFGVSRYGIMMAALGMTLAKYCASEDVIIGTAMSGRNTPEEEKIIGMFVNMLPLRLKPESGMPVKEYILQTAQTIKDVKKHQSYPFEKLVPLLAPDRTASRSPVFDVIFNYLPEVPLPSEGNLKWTQKEIINQELAIDILLEAIYDREKVSLTLSYSPQLYLEEIMTNFMEQYLCVLKRLEDASGNETIIDIAEMPESQRRQILEDFKGFQTDANVGKTVVDLFCSQAQKTPDNRAVKAGEKILTYKELDDITTRLASDLNRKGIQKGDYVGIMVHRTEMMPLCALAVLKAGAGYLPMDPGYPNDRLQFMSKDAGIKIIIADRDLYEKFTDIPGEFIDTALISELPAADPKFAAADSSSSSDSAPIDSDSVADRLAFPAPDDNLILLYTSGTTGNPKGVMIQHRNLSNFIHWYSRTNQITEKDNIPAYASFGFDACMMDMFPTLVNGACLHIIPEDMRLDLDRLEKYFKENNINIAFMTTQLGRQFAETADVPSLRALGVGGETLVPLEPPQNFKLNNLYGPTECTIISTAFQVDRMYDRIPIGKPVDNTCIYVLDKNNRLAPIGTAGELCIAGRQVAKGYLNNPELTAEKFISNPYADHEDNKIIYKSGDIVRYLPDGNIDFVGRRDFQVKIRGFRIELAEIERCIRTYPEITDAAVIAQDESSGGKRVVAYITAGVPVDVPSLNSFIETVLPPYMVPSATMQLDKIPLNQNGKVNRKALPQIQIIQEEIIPPKNELQKQLAEIVKGLLKETEIGINTDLMYAGLNSLSAIKAAALMTEKTGRKISAVDIMREKTIERIESLLEKSEIYTEKQYEKREKYPLTNNQLGLYFACIKNPGTLEYNIPFAFSLDHSNDHSINHSIDCQKLKKAIESVIDAHAYMKTHFTLENNEPMQLRLDEDPAFVKTAKCTSEEYENIKKSFVRPFNFFEGPLYRIEIYETPDSVNLLCDFHHMIFDGGSLDIFLKDLAAAYEGQEILKEKYTSFDAALSEKENESGSSYREAEAYFREKLKDNEGATHFPRDKESEKAGKPRKVTAPILKKPLQTASKKLGITPSDLFEAASGLVIGRLSSIRNVRFASIMNGRDDVRFQNNIGMLVKTVPVLLEIPSDMTSSDYLKKVREDMTQTYNHAQYPFMRIVSEYGYNAEILFAYQGGVISEHSLNGSLLHPEELSVDKVKFPISINIQEKGDDYIVQIQYDDVLFYESSMQAFADCIAEAALSLIQNLEKPLSEIGILTERQRAEAEKFNYPIEPVKARNLHSLFESEAAKNPDKIILKAADGNRTYDELNKQANQLAHSLIEKGIQKEDRIAFMLPRTGLILVSMLGILKSGAAYIPIDPDYPKDRIEHILEDSGAEYILTDGTAEIRNSIDLRELMKNPNTDNPNLPVNGDDLCYIIYTSGSTGKPKGVMLTHAGISNYVAPHPNNRHVQALIENDCVMASVTTVSFDMFLKEAFTTLMNGLTLVLADDEQSKNPDKLARLMKETGATAFNATPSRMLQYMELPEMKDALKACKVIMAGGEGYPPSLYTKLKENTKAVLINTYGPTEITVSSNGKILDAPDITIGAPLYNVVEEIMDIDGNPLPTGAVGELWIGGAGVARGYFGNEEMTKDRFVFRDGIRYYKSGDLAKRTQNGEIIILGRNDGQIKLRGLRIELGEIENTLNSCEGVLRAVAAVKEIRGQEHLCAYYTADRPISAEELRGRLSDALPKYMVPTAYLQMDELPMTANGKADMKALPEAKLMQKDVYEAPANDIEKAFCDVFESVLKMEKVGATDNFFDLGGTSLLVTQLTIDSMKKGFEISYGDVFVHPTPRELAEQIGKEGKTEEKPDMLKEYDYTKIHELLQENDIRSFKEGLSENIGNVCITGTTGFLGIHVLWKFIHSETGTAYCIVRGGKTSAEERLKSMLVYYFSDGLDKHFGSRLVVIDGDITNEKTYETLDRLPIDTYINCAANVKHFSSGTDIEDINIGGVVKSLAFCKRKKCLFVQISTASIAGMSIDGYPDETIRMDEKMFYFGQDLSNKYVNSKFTAELRTLEAASEGADVKIVRVGNLMARNEDGEFQANFNTNNFLGRLRAYSIIGKIPYEDLDSTVEFSPIDSTAESILKLCKTPEKCRVFHSYNNHTVFMSDIIQKLKDVGVSIEPCERDEYDKAYSDAFMNQEKARYLNSLIAYQEHGKRVVILKTKNAYTNQILLRSGFKWPITTDVYLKNFFEMMESLGFFDLAFDIE